MPTVAIIGASPDRHKFGNKAVRAYVQQGWEVFPINPNAPEVEGRKTYPSISDIPASALDRVSVYLPPATGIRLLDEIAKKPSREVWFNPGAESPELLRRARELGMNVIAGCSIVDIGVSPGEFP